MTTRSSLMTVDEVCGVWAIMPTPSIPNASDWREDDTVDHEEAARAVEALIGAGVNGILTLGTLGECGALSWDEKRAFMATIAETAAGRIPVFGGTTTLSTRETVRQTRVARDLGLDGTMVGPPMWNKPDIGAAVQFYRDIAEAVPDMAICVYANPFVFKFDFPTPFWAQVAMIPQVVCAKIPGYGSYLRDTNAVDGHIRLMPIDAEFYGAARLSPEECTAFWSSGASCGPAPVVALRDLVEQARTTGDWSAAKQLSDEIGTATLPAICYGDLNEFQMHNVALEKGRMEASGWMRPGPNRPPHHVVPDHIRHNAEQAGRLWAELQRKYSSVEAV